VVDEDGREVASRIGYTALGWSDRSDAEAREHALTRARRFAAWHQAVGTPREHDIESDYYERPMREPVVEQHDDGDTPTAVITRNSYGAYVLNTAVAAFIDIDDDVRPPSLLRAIGKLFRRRDPVATPPIEDNADPRPPVACRLLDSDPSLGLRLYRTAAGHRVLITSHAAAADSHDAQRWLDLGGADRKYARLCRVQRCYRARLTPKPWRLGIDKPPAVFPFESERERQEFDQWSREYEDACRGHAACELIGVFGAQALHPAAELAIKLHDQLACSGGKLA